jgi:signal transduction histidine kinase
LLAEKAVRQKTLFIQNVSHQIRTPLNIIAGFAQVLQENPALPEHEKAEITDMMLHNAIHFKRMVLMLFNCSDIGISEELKSKRNDVVVCNQLAHDCLDYTRRYAPNAIINVESSLPDSCTIKTNRLYLTRSLHELLFNAVKYSDGKHITLRISQTENTVRFVVEDVGKGLPNEFIDQMFEPFTKSDDLSQGLGLGLPLTKRHIVSLGGELTLDTTYHDGCRFIIDMPKS